MNCCPPSDPNGLNEMFSGRYLENELRNFRRRGLDARQRFMVEQLRADGRRVADLGAGTGALGLSAAQRGASDVRLVELSEPSLTAARRLARDMGVSDRIDFELADAAYLPPSPPVDAVVLDRVVCCYPDAVTLLNRAAQLSSGVLIFSYPLPAWWVRLGGAIGNGLMAIGGRRYRLHINDERTLLEAASVEGHHLSGKRRFGIWQVATLARG